ncbi:MAG: sigma-70 family RNA polymerase sigma factor [Bacillota bacterium]
MTEELHLRLQRRDPAALDELMDRHADAVHWLVGLVLGRTGQPEDVEEAVADTFVRAWERASEFDPGRTSLRSWVLMIAKYTALDQRRRLLRRRYTADGEPRLVLLPEPESPPEPGGGPEEELLRKESGERLHQALRSLSPADQELLVRRYLLEEPITQIAQELRLTRTAIDNRLWRARQALKAALARLEGVHEIG